MADDLRMRLQTDSQRRPPLREQSAKSIFVRFQVMFELPVLQRPQGKRQTRSFRKHVRVIAEYA